MHVYCLYIYVQADLRDTLDLTPNHHKTANTTIESSKCFGFPVLIKVMLKLYCDPLSER